MWKRKFRTYAKRKHYSVVGKLEREGRLDERLQIGINNLTLEELLAVKLELAAKASGGKIYGLPVWFSITDIVRDAVLKFALSATRTKMEAARFLGISLEVFNHYVKEFGTKGYFDQEDSKPVQKLD